MPVSTLFNLLVDVCGLSQREAAEFLEVRLDTIKSWSVCRRQAPITVLDELSKLAERIDKAAINGLAQIELLVRERGDPGEIELGMAGDDVEARGLGWPCVGAQGASLALIVARGMRRGYRFRVVPRGSTPASSAAADVHDRVIK